MSLYLAYTNPLLGHVYPTVPTLVELRLTQRTKASLDAAARRRLQGSRQIDA